MGSQHIHNSPQKNFCNIEQQGKLAGPRMARDAKAFRLATEFGIETKSQKLKEDVCLIFFNGFKGNEKIDQRRCCKKMKQNYFSDKFS